MTKSLLMIHGIGCGGEGWDRMAGTATLQHCFRTSGCLTLLQLRCLISAWMTM